MSGVVGQKKGARLRAPLVARESLRKNTGADAGVRPNDVIGLLQHELGDVGTSADPLVGMRAVASDEGAAEVPGTAVAVFAAGSGPRGVQVDLGIGDRFRE